MIAPISQMLESLQDPAMRHAALVHMPIVLSILGIPAAALAVIFAKRPAVRWTAVALHLAVATSGWFAAESGEDAHAGWTVQMTEPAYATFDDHEELAEWVWRIGLAVAVLLALGALRAARVRAISSALAIIGSLVCAGWVGYTAHLGGRMVYEFGAGTPQPLVAVPAAPPAAALPGAGSTVDGSIASGSTVDGSTEPGPAGSAVESDPRVAFFRAEVFPILEQNCIRCHNPAKLRRVAGLDQTTILGMLQGGASGPAIVPGRPEESLLIRAARHLVEDLEMPPDGDRLPDADLDRLDRWVREGAVWSRTPASATAPPETVQPEPGTPEPGTPEPAPAEPAPAEPGS